MSGQLKLDIQTPVITSKVLNTLVEEITENMKNVLQSKAEEYADLENDDRMHNFKRAGALMKTTPEKALLGFMTKHLVSMFDMLDDIEAGKPVPSPEYVNEKLGDIRNYLVLLQALLHERRVLESP